MGRLLGLVLLLGCEAPFLPWLARPMKPEPEYRAWFDAMVACAGVCRTRFGLQEWRVVEGEMFPCPAYHGTCGGWWTPAHTITMASRWREDSVAVSHEMLHDILQRGHGPVVDSVFARCGV
jgi:hypothetical protein